MSARTAGGSGLRRFVPGAPATSAGRADQATTPADQAAAPADQAGREHRPAAGPEEACEMCAAEIPADHGHLADLEQSTLMCACRACYLLFTHSQAGRGRYRAVPDRYRSDPDNPLSIADWDGLEIPVGLAFFLRRSEGGEVTGFYPSPAGATECRLDLQAWQRIAESHPMLTAAAPDLEAILIYRADAGDDSRADAGDNSLIYRADPGDDGLSYRGDAGDDGLSYRGDASDDGLIYRGDACVDCFLVPIDACYELVGRMRLQWRGFDGGSEARASIAEFLDGVRSRSRAFSQES